MSQKLIQYYPLPNTPATIDGLNNYTDPDANGVFTADLLYVNPGSYTLGLVPPSGINGITTTPATPLAVNLTSGQEVTEALTVTGTN